MAGSSRASSTFQHSLARQDYHTPAWATPAAPTLPGTPTGETSNGEAKKKKKAKANVVYSQPADTGTGHNVNTQLVYAVNHLKSMNGPTRLEDIAIHTNTPLDTDAALLDKFRAHERVEYNPKTGLYSYKHDFAVRNKAQLLTEIQRFTRKGGGLSVRTLKESWKEAPAAIEELEKDGDVLVTRAGKDQTMRMVFWNEIPPTEESGGGLVEQEFRDLWHSLNVPDEVELLKALANEGLQATNAEAAVPKGGPKKKGKKGANKSRQVKITNTHLKGVVDLSRDYVPPSS